MTKVEYTPMRVSHIVISRPSCSSRWWECARFDDPISASNYCIFLRKRANDPEFQVMFIEESVDKVAHKTAWVTDSTGLIDTNTITGEMRA